ncbi:hypothetical protein J2S31_000060 [Nitrospina gracilis Nb-211]|nr:hypothetical protein [Nitrospina gracilis Nb-211]
MTHTQVFNTTSFQRNQPKLLKIIVLMALLALLFLGTTNPVSVSTYAKTMNGSVASRN